MISKLQDEYARLNTILLSASYSDESELDKILKRMAEINVMLITLTK